MTTILLVTQGDGVLLDIHRNALLKVGALERRGTGLGLVQVRGCGRDDRVKGVDCLAGGFHAQTVCQVESLDGIIEGGGTIISGACGVGQGAGVNRWNQAILVLDIGCKFGVLGALVTSVRLSAAAMVVATLSLSGSVSATTAIGAALLLLQLGGLLLLLGKLGVHLLALYSTKLVGLRGLSAAAMWCALLFKQEGHHLDNFIGLQSFHLAGQGLG